LQSPSTKILILSDIHYPLTNKNELLEIINRERPDKVILLGDTIQKTNDVRDFDHLIQTATCHDFTFITGDEDPPHLGTESLNLNLSGRKFLFVHGFQFNLSSEDNTRKVAKTMRKIHKNLPVLGYALISKIRSRSFGTYLILGHSHALKFFPRLKVACAGCLTTEGNLYNDRGYLVLERRGKAVTISINALGTVLLVYKV
jgi:uncharacterized protein